MNETATILNFKPADPAGPVSDLLDQLETQVRAGNTHMHAAVSAAMLMGAELSKPEGKDYGAISGLTTSGLGPSHPLGLLVEQIVQKIANGLVSLRNGLASACLLGIELGPAKMQDIRDAQYQPMVTL